MWGLFIQGLVALGWRVLRSIRLDKHHELRACLSESPWGIRGLNCVTRFQFLEGLGKTSVVGLLELGLRRVMNRPGFGSGLLLRGLDRAEEVSRSVPCPGGADGA